MKYNFKQGFSLAEALVGFTLFSLILMLYLPALYLEMSRISQLQTETDQWRIFYEFVQIEKYHSTQLGFSDQKPTIPITTYDSVESFSFEVSACSITFSDGSVYNVSLLTVTP